MDRLNPNGKHRAKFAASHEKTRRGMPFSLVIARYFVYVLIGSLFVAGAVVSLLIAAVNSGVLYPSNYASIDHEAMVGKIEARGTVEDDDVPSCYRWGVFDKTGKLVEGDFDARSEELAEAFLRDGSVDSVAYSSPLGSPVYATSASLENGDVCVLIYDFNPDFVSKALRDAFPDPQGAVLLLGAVLFAAMLALIAMRASHVLQRKLSPLVDAARRIGSRDLDFKIARGNVRETNEVLDAVDEMRLSLKESLEEQWACEQAQQEAFSSLAHDLKTPLTIVRANADLLLESELEAEQKTCAAQIRDASLDMKEFVERIIGLFRAAPSPQRRRRRLGRCMLRRYRIEGGSARQGARLPHPNDPRAVQPTSSRPCRRYGAMHDEPCGQCDVVRAARDNGASCVFRIEPPRFSSFPRAAYGCGRRRPRILRRSPRPRDRTFLPTRCRTFA